MKFDILMGVSVEKNWLIGELKISIRIRNSGIFFFDFDLI